MGLRTLSPHLLPARGQKWRRRGWRGMIGRGDIGPVARCCGGLQRGSVTQCSDDLSLLTTTRLVGPTPNCCLPRLPGCLRIFCTYPTESSMLLALSRPQQLRRPRNAPPRGVHHSRKSARDCGQQITIRESVTPNLRFEARTAGRAQTDRVFPRHLTSWQWNVQQTPTAGNHAAAHSCQLESAVGPPSQGHGYELEAATAWWGWLWWARTRQDPRILPLARPAS